ncbi:MAG: hypothetical protein WCK27_20805, partial [Verrucomicrobiota bacterium]
FHWIIGRPRLRLRLLPQLPETFQIVDRQYVTLRGKLDRFLQGFLCLVESAQFRQPPASGSIANAAKPGGRSGAGAGSR